MYTIYRLNVNELDQRFIESLKAVFSGKDLEIVVTEVDETTYLLDSEANRARLLQAIQRVNEHRDLIEFDLDSALCEK